MSTHFLRHVYRRVLAKITLRVSADPSGGILLFTNTPGAQTATILDALSVHLADRHQKRISLFPWHRASQGSLASLLPIQLDDTIVLIDNLHHCDDQSLQELISRVRHPDSTTTVIASVEGTLLDAFATEIITLPPFTLAEASDYLHSVTGARTPVDTVNIIHTMSGGWPAFIDDILDSAPTGYFEHAGAQVAVPAPWRSRWREMTETMTQEGIDKLLAGTPDSEAIRRGLIHTVAVGAGTQWEFIDPRDAAVAASLTTPITLDDSPTPGTIEFNQLHLDRALHFAEQLDFPTSEIYLNECAGSQNSGQQNSLRGYLALYRGLRRQAHTNLNGPGVDPTGSARGVLLSLADWDPETMLTQIKAIRAKSPDPEVVMEASILGLIAQAAQTGTMPAITLEPQSTHSQQMLNMIHGWLSLTFDDPLTAREKLQSWPQSSPALTLWQDAWLARTLFVLGEWSNAARVVERGLAIADTHAMELLEPLLLWTGAQIATMQGDQQLSHYYLSRLSPSEDAFLLQALPAAMGRMIVSSTDSDLPAALRAGEMLAGTVAMADTQHPGFWPWEDVYAQTLIRAGKIDLADQVITSAEQRHNPSGLISLIAKNSVPRASIQIQRGDLNAGLKTLESAAEAISTTPMPAYEARILFEYGKVLRRHGRRSRADEVISHAAELYSHMGATLMVQRCAVERRIGGVSGAVGSSTTTQRHNPHGLTPQEEQIAIRVAEGATNADVASELTLSTKTVEYHLTRTYRKMGVRSRQELRGVLGRR